MEKTLWADPCDDWKDRLIQAIRSIAEQGDDTDGNSVYWLVLLIQMFDRIKKTGVFN